MPIREIDFLQLRPRIVFVLNMFWVEKTFNRFYEYCEVRTSHHLMDQFHIFLFILNNFNYSLVARTCFVRETKNSLQVYMDKETLNTIESFFLFQTLVVYN